MPLQQELPHERIAPPGFHELQIAILGRTVNFIPDDRESGMGEMHADLVGSPGNRPGTQKGKLSFGTLKTGHHFKLGSGRRSQRVNRSFEPDPRPCHLALTDNRRLPGEPVGFRPAPDNGNIGLADFSLLHGNRGRACGGGVFRHENDPARLAIQTVDERDLPAVCDFVSEEFLEFVPKCALPVGLARMHKNPRRLVDHQKIRGLTQNFEVGLIAGHIVTEVRKHYVPSPEGQANVFFANTARARKTFAKIASQKIVLLVIVVPGDAVAAPVPTRGHLPDGNPASNHNDHTQAG